MKADVMKIEVPVTIDREKLQSKINSGAVAVSKSGRRVALAYVGLWAFTYDRAADLYQDGVNLLEDAVKRGEGMEQALNRRLGQAERSAAKQFTTLQNRFGDNVEQVTRTVTETGEGFEDQLEKQVERVLVNLGIPTRDRLERLNQEIDRLNVKLDEELARQETVHA